MCPRASARGWCIFGKWLRGVWWGSGYGGMKYDEKIGCDWLYVDTKIH
jgi:hypothetical protein